MGGFEKYARQQATKRANGTPCTWCARVMDIASPDLMPTRDHVHPRWQRGKWTVWACWTCNNIKGGKTLQQWEEFMQTHPIWWEKRKVSKEHKQWFANRTKERPNPLAIIPIAESRYILTHGKKAWRAAKVAGHDFNAHQ